MAINQLPATTSAPTKCSVEVRADPEAYSDKQHIDNLADDNKAGGVVTTARKVLFKFKDMLVLEWNPA